MYCIVREHTLQRSVSVNGRGDYVHVHRDSLNRGFLTLVVNVTTGLRKQGTE